MTDKERKRIANRKYYEKNKDRLAEKWKHDDKRKEYLKEYYVRNKDTILKRAKDFYLSKGTPQGIDYYFKFLCFG